MPIPSTPMLYSAAGSIVASAWISGNIAALSFCTIPALLKSAPGVGIAKAWHVLFKHTAYIPITTVITALNYIYLAHQHRLAGLEWRGYAAGSAANLMVLVFTNLFIMRINFRLMTTTTTGNKKPPTEEEAVRLVKRWGDLNYYRIIMPLAGAVLGFWNFLTVY